MPAKGKGQIVNRTGLSDVFGVALNTIDSWVRQGCPYVQRGAGRGREWQFNTADVNKWLQQKRAAEAKGNSQESEAEELRLRKLAAETELAELELAKAKGDVAPVSEFERAQARAFAEIRTNVMNVAQRVVIQLLGCTDETEFKTKLRKELALALQAAADSELTLSEEDQEDPDELA